MPANFECSQHATVTAAAGQMLTALMLTAANHAPPLSNCNKYDVSPAAQVTAHYIHKVWFNNLFNMQQHTSIN